MNETLRGQPGFREGFDTGGEIVGLYLDHRGDKTPTTGGTIHYSRHGAHIIPSRPLGPDFDASRMNRSHADLTEDEREELAVMETELLADDVLGHVATLVECSGADMAVLIAPRDQALDPRADGIAFLRPGETVPEGYRGAMPLASARAHLVPHRNVQPNDAT